jgi:hypothetical protein
MNASIPDRTTVRQYLLGRLDDKPAVESDLSERIFFSDDLSEMVDSVEDEIIEEYLDGTLDSSDKNAVEEYFLRALERKEKLRFSRLLRHHFQTKQSESIATRVDALPRAALDRDRVYAGSAVYWRSHVRAYWQVAALVLLTVVSLVYISGIRKRAGVLEAELVRERQRSASPVKEEPRLQSSVIALTLVSDRSRSAVGEIPHIDLNPSTQRIIVEIALPDGTSGPYDVRLATKDEKAATWSAKLLPLVSPSGDARLMFDVPAQGIQSGVSSFVVTSSHPEWRKHYDFQAKLAK